MHVRPIFTRTGIALRIVLMMLFAGGIAPWLAIRVWDMLPLPFDSHLVVGAGITRALMTLGMAWTIFPGACLEASRQVGRHKSWFILPLAIAATVVAAKTGALIATANTQIHWYGFNWTQVGYLTAFGVGTAVFEEVLFRFVLLDRLSHLVGTPIAFAIQLGLFTFFHLDSGPLEVGQLLHAAFAGCVLSLIYLQTRSLWSVITLHFTYNLLTGALFGIGIDGVQLYPMLSADNFGKAHGRLAAAAAFACWAALLSIQRSRPLRQPLTAGVAHG